eukprot:209484-Rhodomonas_salina.3
MQERSSHEDCDWESPRSLQSSPLRSALRSAKQHSILKRASSVPVEEPKELKRALSFSKQMTALKRVFTRKSPSAANRVRFSQALIWEYDSSDCKEIKANSIVA